MNPALRLAGLRLTVGGRPVVHGLDLTVTAGERVALVGRSGSGKSLTAAAVAGHLPMDTAAAGDVRIDGHPVLDVRAGRRVPAARASMMFQDSATALNPLTTVGRQLTGPQRRRGLSRAGAAARALELLTAVGIDGAAAVLGARPDALSGGERQRVCLAMALLSPAAVLIADEPTTALDVVTQAAVLELLRVHTGAGRAALLFITHDIAVAAQSCERLVVIDDGRIVEDGPVRQLLAHPVHPATVALVSAARDVDERLPHRAHLDAESACR